MDYKLILSDGYKKVPFPGLNIWIADLRANADKKGCGCLCKDGQYCCLGRLSLLQGRLSKVRFNDVTIFRDGLRNDGDETVLNFDNPYVKIISANGQLPRGVSVEIGLIKYYILSAANDKGLSFLDIADILEQVYEDAGEILK